MTRLNPATCSYSALRAAGPFDVALLRSQDIAPSFHSLFGDAELGFPEPIFVVDEATSPNRFAIASLGFRYILPMAQLSTWLPGALPRLCALSLARRLTASAHENAPQPPLAGAGNLPSGDCLHAAETRFRETLLRLLLAEHGTRRKAAEKAGVPYRSFCEMLRKLDI